MHVKQLALSGLLGLSLCCSFSHGIPPPSLKRSNSLSTPPQTSKITLFGESVLVPSGGAASTGTGTGTGTASQSSEVFNLVKNIVGAGVLALPAGIAAFGDHPSAILPATILTVFIGLLSGYSFSMIGRVCALTGARTFREAWELSVGKSTSVIPAAVTTSKTAVATIAYSMILADTLRALLSTGGYNLSRQSTLLGLTGGILLPLCLLKDLAALAPFSLLGIAGMVYTTAAMAFRYLGGAYKAPAGKFLASIPKDFAPKFGVAGATAALSPASSILLCMLSTAYLAHYNAPKYYVELKDNTIKRYNQVVMAGFATSMAFFSIVGAVGFATFGKASQGLILNNYANTDAVMGFSRIAVFVSIVFSYPLAFVGLRDGVLDLAKTNPATRTNKLLNLTTGGLLGAITLAALNLSDLSFVLSFGGATLGNAIIFVFPALMFRAAVKKAGRKDLENEVLFANGIAGLGVGMGIIGAKMALAGVSGGH